MEEKTNQLELVESQEALRLVPTWELQVWWFFVAAGVILLIGLLFFFWKRRKPVIDLQAEKKQAYANAKAELGNLSSEDSRYLAIETSIILRRYLARSMGEPALFETNEEFISRHNALADLPAELRDDIASFFSALALVKYAPKGGFSEETGYTQATSLALLERMYRV
jgi:LPXTG-motif cell wall-anchored protein